MPSAVLKRIETGVKIGGPASGGVEPMRDGDRLLFTHMKKMIDPISEELTEPEMYIRSEFVTEHHIISYWRHHSLRGTADVLQELIDAYANETPLYSNAHNRGLVPVRNGN